MPEQDESVQGVDETETDESSQNANAGAGSEAGGDGGRDDHVHRLNQENAARRLENKELKGQVESLLGEVSSLKDTLTKLQAQAHTEAKKSETAEQRAARLERGLKQRAVNDAKRKAVAALVDTLEEAGKSVDMKALSKLVEGGHIAVSVDLDNEVQMVGDDRAELATTALERVNASIADVVGLVTHDKSVVPPPKPQGESVADRSAAGGDLDKIIKEGGPLSWDVPSPLERGGKGRQKMRDAARSETAKRLLATLHNR